MEPRARSWLAATALLCAGACGGGPRSTDCGEHRGPALSILRTRAVEDESLEIDASGSILFEHGASVGEPGHPTRLAEHRCVTAKLARLLREVLPSEAVDPGAEVAGYVYASADGRAVCPEERDGCARLAAAVDAAITPRAPALRFSDSYCPDGETGCAVGVQRWYASWTVLTNGWWSCARSAGSGRHVATYGRVSTEVATALYRVVAAEATVTLDVPHDPDDPCRDGECTWIAEGTGGRVVPAERTAFEAEMTDVASAAGCLLEELEDGGGSR